MNYPTSYTSTVSVPLPDDDAIRSVVGDTYDPGTALNVIKMFAGTEDLYPALIGMVNAIFGTKDIDAKHREMIILRAAKVLDTPYEWQANTTMAGNAGLSDADISAAASDGSVAGIDPEYVRICRATDELSQAHTLTDETHRAAGHLRRGHHPEIHSHDRLVQPAQPLPQRNAGAAGDHRQDRRPDFADLTNACRSRPARRPVPRWGHPDHATVSRE
jgi:alkylhydroperoxidase family enzyme